jgi:predicted nucleic acid-binding protein
MRVALDTNLLIYAEFEPETAKGAAAASLLLRALHGAIIPVQVLGEYLRFVQRRHPARLEAVTSQIGLFRTLAITPATTEAVLSQGAVLARDHGLQLWDGVICAAAIDAGAAALITEDLQDGRRLHGLRIVNPFADGNRELLDQLVGR